MLARKRNAFTLIELLTVIAIIGILAAIIIPTVGAVRASARSAQTVSNLRQIGQGLQNFAGENKDYLPGGWNKVGASSYISWHRVLYPYVGVKAEATDNRTSNVFQCGIAISILPIGDTVSDDNKLNFTCNGYIMTDRAHEGLPGVLGNPPSMRVSQIRTPSQTVMVFDGASRDNNATLQGTSNPFWRPDLASLAYNAPITAGNLIATGGKVNGDNSRFAFRHKSLSTMYAVMADSSVRSFRVGELLKRHITP